MSELSNQEIYNAGFNAATAYAEALGYASRYSSDKEPGREYELLNGVITSLALAIKHTQLAGLEKPVLDDELKKWLLIFEPVKIEYENSLEPLDGDEFKPPVL